MICKVQLTVRAQKQLLKLPVHIRRKLQFWVFDVQLKGLGEVRKIPGFHDEPLQGRRNGQRSIRLNRAYRAIYEIKSNGDVEFVEIVEVNKHDYR